MVSHAVLLATLATRGAAYQPPGPSGCGAGTYAQNCQYGHCESKPRWGCCEGRSGCSCCCHHCSTCPTGTWSKSGATHRAQCTAQVPAGYYNDGKVAGACPAGKWSAADATGKAQCAEDVPAGHYNDGTLRHGWSFRACHTQSTGYCSRCWELPKGKAQCEERAGQLVGCTRCSDSDSNSRACSKGHLGLCPIGNWSKPGAINEAQCT